MKQTPRLPMHAEAGLQGPPPILVGSPVSVRRSVRPPFSLPRRYNLDRGVVPLVACRCSIMNIDQPKGGGWCGGRLHPVCVACYRVQPLMHQHLTTYRSPGDRVIPVVAHPEHPGIVPCRNQRRRRCARIRISTACCSDSSGTVRARRVDPGETDNGD